MDIYQVNYIGCEFGFLHIVAATRGKAKSEYINYAMSCNPSECWTDRFMIRLLAKDVDMREGVDMDFAWAQANGWQIADDDGEYTYLVEPVGHSGIATMSYRTGVSD